MNPEPNQEERFAALTLLEQRYAALRTEERASRAPAELLYHAIAQMTLIELLRSQAQVAEARELLCVAEPSPTLASHGWRKAWSAWLEATK